MFVDFSNPVVFFIFLGIQMSVWFVMYTITSFFEWLNNRRIDKQLEEEERIETIKMRARSDAILDYNAKRRREMDEPSVKLIHGEDGEQYIEIYGCKYRIVPKEQEKKNNVVD